MKDNKHHYKNNSVAVYVVSSLKVHNTLFSVGKLRQNNSMGCFIGQKDQNVS